MNPKTGEVLALVSTPAYDSNDFVLGIPADQWEELNKDKAKPLYTASARNGRRDPPLSRWWQDGYDEYRKTGSPMRISDTAALMAERQQLGIL